MEYIVLAIAVIGFIANALKRANASVNRSEPLPRPQAQPPQGAQGAQRSLTGSRSNGSPIKFAAGRPLAGAQQESRIVSQAPMSGIAQQFAQERAAADQKMAAAAAQARTGDGAPENATALSDLRSLSYNAAGDFVGQRAEPAIRRARSQSTNNLINGVIYAQILTTPLCKNKRKRAPQNKSAAKTEPKTSSF